MTEAEYRIRVHQALAKFELEIYLMMRAADHPYRYAEVLPDILCEAIARLQFIALHGPVVPAICAEKSPGFQRFMTKALTERGGK